MNEIDAYAHARNLPEPLRHDLATYFKDAWWAFEGAPGACTPAVALLKTAV
jgi:hypothetical protein